MANSIRIDGVERRLNLSKDGLDVRDLPRVARITEIPVRASVRAGMPAVWDQGAVGYCTGEGWAAMVAYTLARQDVAVRADPSVRFIYYGELDAAGNLPNDVGGTVRSGGMVLVKLGVCDSVQWPFNERFAEKPPLSAYAQAALFQAVRIERISDLVGVRQHIAEGWPVVFGTDLFRSFESVKGDGVVPMPSAGELAAGPIGAHCMVFVGYDDAAPGRPITLRNSWGGDWGDGGYCHVPAEFLEAHASDFWTLEIMENGAITPCGQSLWQRLFGWL